MLTVDATWDEGEFERERERILGEIHTLIHDIADRIGHEADILVSQRATDRGTLKKSRNIIHGGTYSFVGYNTPYAKPVHDGFDSHVQKVKSHERTMMSGVVVRVREHERKMPERSGTWYLDDAVKKVLSQLDENVRNSIEVVRWDKEI